MKWEKIDGQKFMGPKRTGWRSGDFAVTPCWAHSRTGRKLKQVRYRLSERGRYIGRPFATARIAKAFAEAYAALGDNRRAQREFVREGGEWCWQLARQWERERNERRWARYDAEASKQTCET